MTPEQAVRVAAYARFHEDQIKAARAEGLREMKRALAFSPEALKAATKWSRFDYPHQSMKTAMSHGYWVSWVANVYEDIAMDRVHSCDHMKSTGEVKAVGYARRPIAPGIVFGHSPRDLWCLDCGALEMISHVQRSNGYEACALCDKPANATRPASAVALVYWVYAFLCDSCWEGSLS